jgi:hypothetical protein
MGWTTLSPTRNIFQPPLFQYHCFPVRLPPANKSAGEKQDTPLLKILYPDFPKISRQKPEIIIIFSKKAQ